MEQTKTKSTDQTCVLYNDQCPVCSFEIGHYRAYSEDKGLPLRFDDLNSDALAQWGLTRDEAARRLYVLKNGELLGGIDGFLVLWAEMPRYRWLGRLVALPGIRQVAVFLYDWVLAPAIYGWDRRRQNRIPSLRP